MSAPVPDPRQLLSELVSISSPSGDEGAAADFVCDLAERRGLACRRIGESVVLELAGDESGPSLLLNSHLDTVPVGEGWDSDPLDGTWREGRLVARGANDAKVSVASMLHAMMTLADGPALPGRLQLALTACEETDNSGMTQVIEAVGLPDAAVTGEPTGLEVVRAQSGLAVIVARWHGRSCHAAHVARVDHANALHTAATELANLPPYFKLSEHELLGPSTFVATVLHVGDRHNTVPAKAEAVFDGRLAPPHNAEECVALLREHLPTAEITIRSDRLRAVETAADHPLVREALAAAGRDAAIGSNTLSDMALLVGVPAVKCGPGQTARSHTANEYVLEEELLAGCDFYARLAPRALAALASGVETA